MKAEKVYKTTLSHVEEDGFEIMRDGVSFWVCGTCEGEYTYAKYPQIGIMYGCTKLNVEVDTICDENGDEVDTQLTDDELEAFHEHMEELLDEEAKWHDFSEDLMYAEDED